MFAICPYSCLVTLVFAALQTATLPSSAPQITGPQISSAAEVVSQSVKKTCIDCHNSQTSEGDLDLSSLPFDQTDRNTREQWIRIHDRIQQREMPPDENDLPSDHRQQLLVTLSAAIHQADQDDILQSGRGPMRRLNRDEYQQNLRDILAIPSLDIRDMLPEDREARHFNKTAEALDISGVQLTAYLDAAESALSKALATGVQPPKSTKYRASGRRLFAETSTFGEREAMFFARENKAINNQQLAEAVDDSNIELALFRSAHWPYYGYPLGFLARTTGQYRVRFSARSVLQLPGFELRQATKLVPMTFRARKPSGPDVSGDVRATGGLIDIHPEQRPYETIIQLRAGETFEYSLLGLPVPLARNVNGGPPTYRYPPFPEDGQPGVAFQWLEVDGPLAPESWPPESHRILFDELPIRAASQESGLPIEVVSLQPHEDAHRLLRRFILTAARQPISDAVILRFERLVTARLQQGASFTESMLSGYKAFLCSSYFLFLQEPVHESEEPEDDLVHYHIASRLSHFLTNSRPDQKLMSLAHDRQLCNSEALKSETNRLVASDGFDRFVQNFTDYWLNLRHINRDEPDARLHPEYRFDAYLVESMERETRSFFTAMVRENLPMSVLIDADFASMNDRLAEHYQLPAIQGSVIRKVRLPAGSPYGGLLTQAAILKVTANGTTTSPVVRGAWIMDRILGQPAPPPPASVPAVEPDIRGAKTIRELLALHTKSEACASCHARFDPVGLALENFDILGGWRTRYRSLETGDAVTGIDRAGHDYSYQLAAKVSAGGRLPDGREFRDIHELKQLLVADSRGLARNMLYQFTVYATGTPVRFSDRAEIETILNACSADGYCTMDLLHGLIQSRIFIGQPATGNSEAETAE